MCILFLFFPLTAQLSVHTSSKQGKEEWEREMCSPVKYHWSWSQTNTAALVFPPWDISHINSSQTDSLSLQASFSWTLYITLAVSWYMIDPNRNGSVSVTRVSEFWTSVTQEEQFLNTPPSSLLSCAACVFLIELDNNGAVARSTDTALSSTSRLLTRRNVTRLATEGLLLFIYKLSLMKERSVVLQQPGDRPVSSVTAGTAVSAESDLTKTNSKHGCWIYFILTGLLRSVQAFLLFIWSRYELLMQWHQPCSLTELHLTEKNASSSLWFPGRLIYSHRAWLREADKEKQMRFGGFVMQVGQKLQQLDMSVSCFPFTQCTVHLASCPGAMILVGGGNWLRLKLCGTENELHSKLWHNSITRFTLPEGPPAEGDHDRAEQQLCSLPVPTLSSFYTHPDKIILHGSNCFENEVPEMKEIGEGLSEECFFILPAGPPTFLSYKNLLQTSTEKFL